MPHSYRSGRCMPMSCTHIQVMEFNMRSHYCGQLNESLVDQHVTLCGWVHRRRDHGGVIFIDLRDRDGIAQVVVNPDMADAFATADRSRSEYVLNVEGLVRLRPEGTRNSDMPTGMIEVVAEHVQVLNESKTPPFQLEEHNVKVGEDIRLKHRYIDLRRPEMIERFRMRSRVTHFVRHYLEEQGFLDVETPILTRATPEGARDYLVPSRTHAGEFFALPQSPQLFKQLLMVSGFDRYYQVAKCFRDEDLRADRQPEFTQIDIEASFVDEDAIMSITEDMIRKLFNSALDVELPAKFDRMPYSEAMHRFGSDKPDMRIPLELIDISDLMSRVDFNVFSGPAKDDNGRVAALKVPGGAKLSRKEIDDYTRFVGIYGAKGLAWIKVNERKAGIDGLQSPIVKFMTDVVDELMERLDAQDGDIIFFGADRTRVVNEALGALRVRLGEDLNLYTHRWAPLWVVDFPTFEKDDSGKLSACHHPFTAPACSVEEFRANPGDSLSRAYDMVLNGTELGGGSIRIHEQDMQRAVFDVLGISNEEAEEKFGFLLDALQYGAPPHGGLAFGLDRLVMLMTGASTIRDVIAFPKTQSAACPLTDAPGEVSDAQLKELNLRLRKRDA